MQIRREEVCGIHINFDSLRKTQFFVVLFDSDVQQKDKSCFLLSLH